MVPRPAAPVASATRIEAFAEVAEQFATPAASGPEVAPHGGHGIAPVELRDHDDPLTFSPRPAQLDLFGRDPRLTLALRYCTVTLYN